MLEWFQSLIDATRGWRDAFFGQADEPAVKPEEATRYSCFGYCAIPSASENFRWLSPTHPGELPADEHIIDPHEYVTVTFERDWRKACVKSGQDLGDLLKRVGYQGMLVAFWMGPQESWKQLTTYSRLIDNIVKVATNKRVAKEERKELDRGAPPPDLILQPGGREPGEPFFFVVLEKVPRLTRPGEVEDTPAMPEINIKEIAKLPLIDLDGVTVPEGRLVGLVQELCNVYRTSPPEVRARLIKDVIGPAREQLCAVLDEASADQASNVSSAALEFTEKGPGGERTMTSADAAEFLGLSEVRIRQYAQNGRIGEQIGGRWLFSEAELREFRNKPRPTGKHLDQEVDG